MARILPPLEKWLIPKLRRNSLIWPGKSIARDKARVYISDGEFKNGKPKTKLKYKCAKCEGLFEKEETAMDHIKPAMQLEGFKDWNTYIPSLFCNPNNYQCLCKSCHLIKTTAENKQRKIIKKDLTYSKKYAKINNARKNKKFLQKRKRNRFKRTSRKR